MDHNTLPYCEAYPRLAASEFRRASQADEPRDHCRFSTASGGEVGWLYITRPWGDGYEAIWKFRSPHLSAETGINPISYQEPQGKVGRPSPFTCSRCKKRTGNLYFKDCWACRLCHGLKYRSTFLPSSVRLEEALVDRQFALRQQIGGGRPRYMRQTTYQSLKGELHHLDRRSPSLGIVVANAERSLLIDAEWMTEEIARQSYGFHPDLIFGNSLKRFDKDRGEWF